MKNAIRGTAIILALAGVTSVNAALDANEVLLMGPQTGFCAYDLGSYPDACIIQPIPSSNFFAMDTDGDGIFSDSERVGITGYGITLGIAQSAGEIDDTWMFFGAPGNHTTNNGLVVASDDGAGNATINMSGWNVHWNGSDIDMGRGAAATVTCNNTCENGDRYTLDYTAVVPSGGFSAVWYQLHLTGAIGKFGPEVPTKSVSIQLSGGNIQECSSTGGSSIDVTANISTTDINDIASISWSLDGADAGTGNLVNVFTPLGTHTLSVVVDTFASGLVQNTQSLTITDRTPPELNIRFIDKRSGLEVTEVAGHRKHFVTVKYDISDVCDPEPAASGVAVPVHAINDGGTILIKERKLATATLDTSAVNISANVIDASGNRTHSEATLLIVDQP